MILYGDLDISVINEMPANRSPDQKLCCGCFVSERKRMNLFERKSKTGHQAYVICPMVEESEAMDAENVVEYTEVLRTELPPAFAIEYLHGKMKPKEKNEIMERFLAGGDSGACLDDGHRGWGQCAECDGDDDRKFRTVRAGTAASAARPGRPRQVRRRTAFFCTRLDGKQIRERLDILCKSNDGFEIANRDMQLRGPGDLFGVRQSGTAGLCAGGYLL